MILSRVWNYPKFWMVAIIILVGCVLWHLLDTPITDDTGDNYTQIYNKFPSVSSDIWLKAPTDGYEPLATPSSENYTGCLRGGLIKRTYGTNRSFEDVLVDYKKAFPEMSWNYKSAFDNAGGSLLLDLIRPSSPDYASGA